MESYEKLKAQKDTILERTDEIILRRLLWRNHGHTGMYGDDGEMQCAMCWQEYGFVDWLRTPAVEIETKILFGQLKKIQKENDRKRVNYEGRLG